MLVVVVGSTGVVGCSKNDFTDRTAKVVVDGRTTTFDLDSCGRDGVTVFLVGRSSAGDVLQAVVGVEADHATGVPESTGLSISTGSSDLAAFGAEAWARRGETAAAPGRVESTRVRGSRIQASGRLVETAAPPGSVPKGSVPFSLDARCDRQDKPKP